jgi:hypothetical protein
MISGCWLFDIGTPPRAPSAARLRVSPSVASVSASVAGCVSRWLRQSLRAPRMLAPAQADALANRDRAIARIHLKFANNGTSFLHCRNQCYYEFIRVFQK